MGVDEEIMKKMVNGNLIEMSEEEVALIEARQAEEERRYWQTTPYDEAVNAEIRKKYSESQEFAVLRQRDEKPDEYTQYYAYCEECKALVKEKRAEFTK